MARLHVALLLLAVALVTQSAGQDNLLYCKLPRNESKIDIDRDCDVQKYADEKAPEAGVAIVIGVFLSFVMFVVSCARACCNCCGGKTTNPDSCCFGVQAGEQRTLEQRQLLYWRGVVTPPVLKLLVLGTAVMGCVALVLATVGFPQVRSGFDSFWSTLYDGIDWFSFKVVRMEALLQVPGADGNPEYLVDKSIFDSMRETVADIRSTVDDQKSAAHDIFHKLVTSLSIVFSVVPVVLLMFLVLGSLCNSSCLLSFCLMTITFVASGLWILCGVVTVIHVITTDLCHEIDNIGDGVADGLIGGLLLSDSCPDDFSTYQTDFTNARRNALQTTCSEMLGVCSSSQTWQNDARIFICDEALLQSAPPMCEYDVAALNDYVSAMPMKTDIPQQQACQSGGSCTLRECAEQCVQDTARKSARDITTGLDKAERANTAFEVELAPFLNCTTIWRKVFGGWEEPSLEGFVGPCATFRDGAEQWRAGLVVGGVAMLLALILALLGKKRFVPKPDIDPSMVWVDKRPPPVIEMSPHPSQPGPSAPPSGAV